MVGNVMVGQSGGPTAVINSSLVGVYQTAKDRGAHKVYGMLHGIQGLLEGKYIDLDEHIRSELDIELLKRTPSAYLGSCKYKLPEIGENDEIYNRIFETLYRLGIRCFFYIGGNNSMDTVRKLTDYSRMIGANISFIGIPKTIDNNLIGTDHTPGYGSAAKCVASIMKEIIRDVTVYDLPSVAVVEIMGGNAGWLAGASALSKAEDCEGPDMIYLPEFPIDPEDFLRRVGELQKKKKSIVVAISEGIKLPDGRYVAELADSMAFTDDFGNKTLTGAARYLCRLVAERYHCKTRAIEFNTLQRCASHIVSRVDITEAFQVGGAAVKAAFEGDQTGKMVTLKRLSQEPYQCATDLIDIHEVANLEKFVPLEWYDNDSKYVMPEFLSYVRPLIQAELSPIMVGGLPRHLYYTDRLKRR